MADRLPPVPPLPDDAICLHLGIHKTGTTALQAALADARAELAAHGVTYPGRRTAHHGAAMAILGRSWGWKDRGGQVASPKVFDRLAREARKHQGRVMISSEQFCEADDAGAVRIVEGLGADRTHVVLALRNLGNLLASSWQQYLKYGQTMGYEKWLTAMLDPTQTSRVTPTFWRRNDHGRLVQRWADVLGPDRVTVLIVEDVDPDSLFRVFAEMLDIPPGVLLSRRGSSPNRSLTAAESEFLRRLNKDVGTTLGWNDYEHLVRRDVAGALQSRRPGPEEPRLHTPAWALQAAHVRSQEAVSTIERTGVRVIGNLEALSRQIEAGPPNPPGTRAALPMEAALSVIAAQVQARAGSSDRGRGRKVAGRVIRQVTAGLPRR